jgi:hypothetical protein
LLNQISCISKAGILVNDITIALPDDQGRIIGYLSTLYELQKLNSYVCEVHEARTENIKVYLIALAFDLLVKISRLTNQEF